ncbi:kinase-like domain-containing protein [Fimicolochytrium jonesii]|uniref:kinase-like domain-containing protein n=1 Tax=Fimicolochytrium jonesii TaxID=1396493 RepID=UPI0022FE304A|nr:kinase-like domain-containing protein [Fimicolochytrium jonesii]KAI8818899.1 kinase-like domain-containing protein [Fimicolochytrium jonesii]
MSSSRGFDGSGMGASTSRPSYVVAYLSHLFATLYTTMSSFFTIFKPAETITLAHSRRRVTVLKQLGEGGFSFVYLVRDVGDGATYALKRVRIQLPEHEERLKSEIAAHKAVQSPYVVKLVDEEVVKRGNAVVEGLLLLPFYERGTVQDLIDQTPTDQAIALQRILQITMDVCSGLSAFHTHNPPLAFRDLKPANILINTDGRAVLMDLGSVAVARVTLTSRKEAIALQEECAETATAPFRAPELFDPPTNGSVDERSDVWALGCTLYAMAYRVSPFDGTTTATISGRVSFPTPPTPLRSHPVYINAAFRHLILAALTPPASRPTVAEMSEKCRVVLEGLGDSQDGIGAV